MNLKNKTTDLLKTHPFISFIVALLLLLATIAIANYVRDKNGDQVERSEPQTKTVKTFPVSTTPSFSLLGKIEKEGVVTISAQSAGVVQNITKKEGQKVRRGETIIQLSSTYAGSNAARVQSQLAQKSYDLTETTYNDQLDSNRLRRELAEKADTQADEMREMTTKSLADTRTLLTLNEGLLNELDTTLQALESQNVDGANNELIAQTKSSKTALLGSISGIRTGLKNSEYMAASDQEPAEISDRTRELTLKQLEIEKKSLAVNKEISYLNLRLAKIGEELLAPSAPCNGTIDSIVVNRYSTVAPGSQLATIICDVEEAVIVANTPLDIAYLIDEDVTARTTIQRKEYEVALLYASKESSNNLEHRIVFQIPKTDINRYQNNAYMKLAVNVTNPFAGTYYIPLDALYQTETNSSLFVLTKNENGENITTAKTIVIDRIVGSYAFVTEGLSSDDIVILDRGLSNNQRVEVAK